MYPPEDPNMHPTVVSRTMLMDSIDIGAARTILDFLSTSNAPMRAAQLRVLGGAMARVSAGATAFAHRSKGMLVNVAAFSQGAATRDAHAAWVAEFARALQSIDEGAYVGFLGDDGAARIHSAYPGPTWDRLVRIKATYDPDNLFRLNHNVRT
jgi:FAD/FMN-containing dehydrogenase